MIKINQTTVGESTPFSKFLNFPYKLCGITSPYLIGRNRFCDYGTSTYHTILPDGYSFQDDRFGSNEGIVANNNRLFCPMLHVFIAPTYSRVKRMEVGIIDTDPSTYLHIIPDSNAPVANQCCLRNPHIVPNGQDCTPIHEEGTTFIASNGIPLDTIVHHEIPPNGTPPTTSYHYIRYAIGTKGRICDIIAFE